MTRICVPIIANRAADVLPVMQRAASVADCFEIRADYLSSIERAKLLDDLPALVTVAPRPLILTLRTPEQGGHSVPHEPLALNTRIEFHTGCLSIFDGQDDVRENFVDIELDLALHLQQTNATINWQRVICSYHDFNNAPPNITELYEQLAATPARVLKLAFTAHDAIDILPVLRLFERARHERRESILIAMNQAGVPTRLLAPLYDSFLTFAAFDEQHATAKGQLAARAMREIYRVHELDAETIITGLIGNPVAHSLSPNMHNHAFAAYEVNAIYVPFEVHNLDAFMTRMVHPRTREIDWNLRGLSVTAPHKESVLPYLSQIDEAAQATGAVNTIIVEGDELRGYNTDACAALEPFVNLIDLHDAKVAVIGAGGAARSVLWSLNKHDARSTIFARRPERAAELAKIYNANFALLAGARFSDFDVVINTTPLGTRGAFESETPATAEQLHGARITYDLVYNPAQTIFLREAESAGCQTINGLPMLVAQAAAQWRLWTKLDAEVETLMMNIVSHV